MKIVRNAGITSDISSQGISFTEANIIAPTITSVGVVAKAGIALNTGMKNTDSANNPATTKAVNPVRPPSATPAPIQHKPSRSTYRISDRLCCQWHLPSVLYWHAAARQKLRYNQPAFRHPLTSRWCQKYQQTETQIALQSSQ